MKHHKFDKENYEKIFYLKNKESVTIYCTKHSEHESVQKIKYQQHNGGGTKNKFKITKVEKERARYYPPKSSKRTFSSGIPQSSAIFKTAWFIRGGPQKYNSTSSGAS